MQNLVSSGVLFKIKMNRSVVLSFVLYDCEIWSLTFSEERRLRRLENMVLRGLFGPKRDEETRDWVKLHNEELNLLKPELLFLF